MVLADHFNQSLLLDLILTLHRQFFQPGVARLQRSCNHEHLLVSHVVLAQGKLFQRLPAPQLTQITLEAQLGEPALSEHLLKREGFKQASFAA